MNTLLLSGTGEEVRGRPGEEQAAGGAQPSAVRRGEADVSELALLGHYMRRPELFLAD